MTLDSATDQNRDAAIQELWHRGIVAPWYLREHQFTLYDLLRNTLRDIIVPNISRRFGKSTTCCGYVLEEAFTRKQDIRYATAFLTDLEGFIRPIFDDILSSCPGSIRPRYKESKKTYYFHNGSTIKLIGLDKNPNGIRGNALDILVIDEAAFVANLEYLYRSIIVPATADRNFKIIFPSTPPESPEHFWARELVEKAKDRETYLELTLDDNTSLSDAEKERLLDEVGGKDSPTAQREFFCKIVVDVTRAVAPSFDEERHVAEFEEPYIKWIIFGDLGGVRDKHAYQKVGWSHTLRRVLIADELTFEPMTPSSVMVEKVQKTWLDLEVYADKPGQTAVDLSALGMPTGDVVKIRDGFGAGIANLNTALHNDEPLIHPRCELLIRTLKGGLLTKNRTDHLRTESFGHNDHVACMQYALRGVDRTTDLRPKPPKSLIFTLPKPETSGLQGLTHDTDEW